MALSTIIIPTPRFTLSIDRPQGSDLSRPLASEGRQGKSDRPELLVLGSCVTGRSRRATCYCSGLTRRCSQTTHLLAPGENGRESIALARAQNNETILLPRTRPPRDTWQQVKKRLAGTSGFTRHPTRSIQAAWPRKRREGVAAAGIRGALYLLYG